MAVFCDFENVALGVRDANYEKFDIKPVLERLLLKGSIVVKKAYCDWERYKGFKATMHEANFELIEIPHVRQSGKNSADIRLVVDALDLCYTKSHVNTFVIISGDSDFSPLVSKLRENNKQVIGVGVKQSTSDLLVANCDEFIFYDDLVREVKRAAAKRDERKAQPAAKRAPDEGNRRKEELETRKAQAIDMVVEMFDALVSERGDSGKIWASLLKDTLKRRRPEFNETYFGFRTFGNLLEEAQARGMLEFGRDEKSGAYVYRSSGAAGASSSESMQTMHDADSAPELADEVAQSEVAHSEAAQPEAAQPDAQPDTRRRGRGGRSSYRGDVPQQAARGERGERNAAASRHTAAADVQQQGVEQQDVEQQDVERQDVEQQDDAAANQPAQRSSEHAAQVSAMPAAEEGADAAGDAIVNAPPTKEKRKQPRDGARKTAARKAKSPVPGEQSESASQHDGQPASVSQPDAVAQAAQESSPDSSSDSSSDAAPGSAADAAEAKAKPARKPASRSRRPAKPKAAPDNS